MLSPVHARSLIRAGISQCYHDETWDIIKKRPDLTKPTRDDIKKGFGVSFVGRSSKTLDNVFFMYARDLHMGGVGCRVVRPAALTRAAGKQSEVLDEWLDIHALFIDGFFLDSPHRECPFRPYEMMSAEEFLKERILSGRPVFLKSNTPVEDATGWWSSDILQLIATRVTEVRVNP